MCKLLVWGERVMASYRHYKWRVVPEALQELHTEFGNGESFSSAVIAIKASGRGRRNTELTPRQIGNVLSILQKKGLVVYTEVREDNARRKMWSLTENGYRVSNWKSYWRG
jgi:hypothetical protein|tara:strand:+ start:391 stop:723 length:333 start_codon:yes stop_codon:yes gene_type:complete